MNGHMTGMTVRSDGGSQALDTNHNDIPWQRITSSPKLLPLVPSLPEPTNMDKEVHNQLAGPLPTPPTTPRYSPPLSEKYALSPLATLPERDEGNRAASTFGCVTFHPEHIEPVNGVTLQSADGLAFRVDLTAAGEDAGFFYDLSEVHMLFQSESDTLLPLPSTGSGALLIIVEWLKRKSDFQRLSLPTPLASSTGLLDDLIRAADMFSLPGLLLYIYRQLREDPSVYPPICFLFAVLSDQVHLNPPQKIRPPDSSSQMTRDEYLLKEAEQQRYWNELEDVTLSLLPFSEDMANRLWWAESLKALAPETYEHLTNALAKWDTVASTFGTYQHGQSKIFGNECQRGGSNAQAWPNGCRYYRQYRGDLKLFRRKVDPTLFRLMSTSITFGSEQLEEFEEAVRTLNVCSACPNCATRLAEDLRSAVREASATFQSLQETHSWRCELQAYRQQWA